VIVCGLSREMSGNRWAVSGKIAIDGVEDIGEEGDSLSLNSL
jgi:hypothetical protein